MSEIQRDAQRHAPRHTEVQPRGFAEGTPQSRHTKARKIEALLGETVVPGDMLDLGAGSGLLSQYFAQRGWRVTAADRDIASFQPSDIPIVAIAEDLPFEDRSFDLVVFNHVVEHVGARAAQRAIVAEIARVLRPDGLLYFAVPNRYAPIEPHYRLPLLGALPRRLASALVRRFGDGDRYDCHPLSHAQARRLLAPHFRLEDKSPQAFAHVVRHEINGPAAALLRAVPAPLIKAARRLFPTLIFVGRKR